MFCLLLYKGPTCIFSHTQLEQAVRNKMFMLSICFIAGLLLSHLQCSSQSCTVGTADQCKEADFAPGVDLAGEGFDITTMQRKGAFVIDMKLWRQKKGTCTLCKNPYVEGQNQKLPLSVEDWRPSQSCSMKVSSKLHRSSESLVSSSTSSVENNWGTNLEIDLMKFKGSLMLAGTHSKLAEYSMEKTKNDKFNFVTHSISCSYYSCRVTGTPKLHRDFRKAVNSLPKCYNQQSKKQYYSLIDSYGTHYITKVKLGGSVTSVTSIRQCQVRLQGYSTDEVEMCLQTEASASIGNNKMKVESKHCDRDKSKMESKESFSSLFNDRFTEIMGGKTTEPELLFSSDKDPSAYKEWLNTLPQLPGIVSYSLASLHELLPIKNPFQGNLRTAISHYILERALWQNCTKPCRAGAKHNQMEPCTCSCQNDPAVDTDCCPTRKGMARVIITVQRAEGLWGDHTTATDGYVKIFFNGNMMSRTPVIYNNNNPRWSIDLDLGPRDLSKVNTVIFEVWDEDNKWNDDLLGKCQKTLTSGVKEDVCNLQYGRLFYKWDVRCAPSLRGEDCTQYIPSPVSQQLQKLYTSRHSHPVPKAMLLKMGVLVDGTNLQSNQTFITQSQHCGGM
ncbi:perforin-1-like [Lampris incognitus]|uniref:perforin-1-like n=1 Tax=Lampris incognitus TaxID=2546036 RepID=UPI0024B58451|nr:perforin-1-like [Lampris incognitus]